MPGAQSREGIWWGQPPGLDPGDCPCSGMQGDRRQAGARGAAGRALPSATPAQLSVPGPQPPHPALLGAASLCRPGGSAGGLRHGSDGPSPRRRGTGRGRGRGFGKGCRISGEGDGDCAGGNSSPTREGLGPRRGQAAPCPAVPYRKAWPPQLATRHTAAPASYALPTFMARPEGRSWAGARQRLTQQAAWSCTWSMACRRRWPGFKLSSSTDNRSNSSHLRASSGGQGADAGMAASTGRGLSGRQRSATSCHRSVRLAVERSIDRSSRRRQVLHFTYWLLQLKPEIPFKHTST